MSDDIVTNLRKIETVGEPLMPWHVTPQQAADEIERLRAELAHAQSEVARLERMASNG